MKADVKSYLTLCKIKVAWLAAFSTAVAYWLAAPALNVWLPVVVPGVFILVCGSLVLNQYQERGIDAAMPRTRPRPIPSGLIKPAHALSLSLLLMCSGLIALLCTGNSLTCALGLLALLWYNGLYTYLKRKTAFAAIPGALIGAIPPAIGWAAGGGLLQDPKLAALCFFFFIWQVPHSWLLIMRYGREYEEAGLPSLTRIFSQSQLRRITVNWILATTVSGLFLSVVGLIHHLPIRLMLLTLSSWLAWNGIRPLLNHSGEFLSALVYKKTNYYLAAVLFLLSTDRLLLNR
jgi:protoheme IX farnesyltransferase